MDTWPPPWILTRDELADCQGRLGHRPPEPWYPRPGGLRSVGGCFVCFQRGKTGTGSRGDPAWAAAVWMLDGRLKAAVTVCGKAGAAYEPGLLAAREGPLLEEAVRRLPAPVEVLLVNATGRDHPRRAGLALHLGARLDLPTVGVTARPLVAHGEWPADVPGAISPLTLEGEVVGYRVRLRQGVHPVAVHAAWRTDPETALAVVLATAGESRTPEPIRLARHSAREARQENRAQRSK